MKRKVIYIAGLYHTGSTLLDLLLGNLPNVIGLGEIFKCFHDKFEEQCSCGKTIENCPFWGEVLSKYDSSFSVDESYELVLETFNDQYSTDKILVDSSKCHPFKIFQKKDDRGMQGLNSLIDRPDIDLYVLHLVRDVRSWSNSLNLRDKRYRSDHTPLENIYMFIFRSTFFRFIQWYVGHKRIIQFINKNKLKSLRISYESLSINPADTLKDCCNFLKIEYDEFSDLSNSKSHIAVGNPMKLRSKDLGKVTYDMRWLETLSHILPSIILLPIMKFNQKLTYGRKDIK